MRFLLACALILSGLPAVAGEFPPPDEMLRLYRQDLAQRGHRILLEKDVVYETRFLNAHGAYVDLDKGDTCRFFVMATQGADQVGFQLTIDNGAFNGASEWETGPYGQPFVISGQDIPYSGNYALWLRASHLGHRKIPLHLVVSCR